MSQATARAPRGSRAAPSHGRAGGTESHLQTDPGSSTHSVWTAHAGRGNLTSLLLLWVLMAKVGALTHRTPQRRRRPGTLRAMGPGAEGLGSHLQTPVSSKGPSGRTRLRRVPSPSASSRRTVTHLPRGAARVVWEQQGGAPHLRPPPALPSPTGHRARGAPRAGRASFQRRSPLEGRFGHEGKEGGEFQGAWGRVWGVEGRQSQVGLRNE